MFRGARFLSRSVLAASFLLLAAPPPTAMPAAVDTIDRTKTLILDMDSGRNLTPDVWNPYVPSSQRSQGLHQAMMEPLFMLNYETGQIQPWLGESMTPNATLD
jgi:peptide/nickel transport system substrate-binding protein